MSFGADEEILQISWLRPARFLSNCPNNWSSWKAARMTQICSTQFFAVSTL